MISPPLQAVIKTCHKCQIQYNDDDFSDCPICHYEFDSPTTQPATQPATQYATPPVTQDSDELAVRLFLLAAQAQPNSNFVFSPESLFQALSNLLMGATGATRQSLANFLGGYQPPSTTEESGAASGSDEVYSFGNWLLLSSRYQLLDAYRRIAEKTNTMIYDNIDFNNESSLIDLARQLNQQISILTQGMMPDSCRPDRWGPDTVLSLINTVYFRGSWKQPFYRDEDGGFFTLANGRRIRLREVLNSEVQFSEHANVNGWQAVTVPYQGNYEMVLVLPPEGTLPSAISVLALADLLSSLQPVQRVELTLPPFESRSDTDLNPMLRQMGLGGLFEQGKVSLGAMLMGSSQDIFLSKVHQKCAIKVNEKGTEASAVTEMVCTDGMVRHPCVNFDRPFLYMLRHQGTLRIVFIGQILDPDALDE
ncbi:serpin family protein [Endozoicomonas sp. 4G]|uniref:serpin family protein n=1 Tax=Endozoicomonas sp. 4G TaxID=2872754 RepID=UPI0020785FE8|nr:serpin family protein [Endozoicomonas sp. 4G]